MNPSIADLAKNACLEVGIEYAHVPADGKFHLTKLILISKNLPLSATKLRAEVRC